VFEPFLDDAILEYRRIWAPREIASIVDIKHRRNSVSHRLPYLGQLRMPSYCCARIDLYCNHASEYVYNYENAWSNPSYTPVGDGNYKLMSHTVYPLPGRFGMSTCSLISVSNVSSAVEPG
jgi:hypothetical protein